MPASRAVTSVETFSGQYVDLLHPHADTIKLVDVAHHLANTCRFAGGVSRYYSVAEHAVRVSRMVPSELALPALHHDSHEFVLGDWPAPLKAAFRKVGDMSGYQQMVNRLDRAICAAFGIPDIYALYHRLIHAADDEAMYREAASLKWSHGVGEHWDNDAAYEPWVDIGWLPADAATRFYERHMELTS